MDDLVDEAPTGTMPDELRAGLSIWRSWLEAWPAGTRPTGPVAEALEDVLVHHGVPASYLLLLLDGVESDVGRPDVSSWIELRAYCFNVASTVGLSMCHIFGVAHDPVALQAATELGVAMQLTNILRDVGDDLRRGRVYLPADELDHHRYSRLRLNRLADALTASDRTGMDDDFRALMAAQITRARAYYRRGLAGVARLPRSCRFAILLAGCLYRAILDEIVAADYDVFTGRVVTSNRRKLAELGRCWLALTLQRQAVPVSDSAVLFRVDDWRTP